ncbi:hypothetical protein GCM10025876_33370 [Demequina litorisediminis]|uniref:LexA repressor DNA-binding domain-containing protein n=1 Tax=Demequina litorisediminis TaxID=1849022 RepID=A0ABQ6IGZ6_9MICO|nr:hypothetical protein GCM10025876_33370 [Demequina litorisediminis]
MAEPTETDATIHEFPDMASDVLTERQRSILVTIRDSVESRGYPPSMREIGQAVGLTSTSSVKHQAHRARGQGLPAQGPAPPARDRGRHAGEHSRGPGH